MFLETQIYDQHWKEALYELGPPTDGIIFMLNNVEDTEKGVPSIGYDQSRLDEHRPAFKHLSDLIFNNSDVMDKLQALLVLVNKNNSWPSTLQYGDLIKASGLDELLVRFDNDKELPQLRRRAQSCSGRYGGNIQGSIAWMARNFK